MGAPTPLVGFVISGGRGEPRGIRAGCFLIFEAADRVMDVTRPGINGRSLLRMRSTAITDSRVSLAIG